MVSREVFTRLLISAKFSDPHRSLDISLEPIPTHTAPASNQDFRFSLSVDTLKTSPKMIQLKKSKKYINLSCYEENDVNEEPDN